MSHNRPSEIAQNPNAETSSLPPSGRGLTPRQIHVIAGLARGHTNKQIAQKLKISTHTVTSHVRRIGFRVGYIRRAGIVGYAYRVGILSGLRPESRSPINLTPGERKVLNGLTYGPTNLQLASYLQTPEHSVKSSVYALLRKLNARSRTHAVAIGYQQGFLNGFQSSGMSQHCLEDQRLVRND